MIVSRRRICPWCRSTRIGSDGVSRGLLASHYYCSDCGRTFLGLKFLGVRVAMRWTTERLLRDPEKSAGVRQTGDGVASSGAEVPDRFNVALVDFLERRAHGKNARKGAAASRVAELANVNRDLPR